MMNITKRTRLAQGASILTCTLMLAGTLSVSAAAVKADSTSRIFANVYPMLYSGTTYLPLRAIGEMVGKTASWNSAGQNANPSSSVEKIPGTAQIPPQTNAGSYIGEEKAKSIALNHAGLTESQVTFIKAELGQDDGRWEYDVEFYTANHQEYDYEIDAYTGAILESDYDVENWSAPQQNTTASQIGVEKAKSIALNHAGLTESQVTFIKAELGQDDGRWEYDVEFYTANHQEYDYEIDAYTGAILESDYDVENWSAPQQNTTASQIGMEKAKTIAVNHAGLDGSKVKFVKAELDHDDGRWKYEIEFISGTWEYEYEIDAYSGTVLEFERESIYD